MSDATHDGSEEEHVPNFVVSPQEAAGVIARRLKLYPEDEAKMRTMIREEALEYHSMIAQKRRYTI